VSYTVDWFIPNGSEPLKKQAERVFSGQWLPASPATISLQQSVAQEIRSLDPTLEIHPSVRGSDHGCWIGSDDPDCLVPYVELRHGTAMVQGGLRFDEEFNEALLYVYSILERHGFVGYDPQHGQIFRGPEEAIKLQRTSTWRSDFRSPLSDVGGRCLEITRRVFVRLLRRWRRT